MKSARTEESAMKSCVKAAMILLLLVAAAPARTSSQDAFNVKELLQKDISKYARGDMLLSLAEITVAPCVTGNPAGSPRFECNRLLTTATPLTS